MGKKITFLMLLVTLMLAVTLLIGCGETTTEPPVTGDSFASDATHHWGSDGVKEVHTLGAPDVTEEATCEEEGETKEVCSVCGYVKTTTIPATGHTFDESKWKSDAVNHWHAASCKHKDEVKDLAAHTFTGGACSVCKMAQPATEGLVYQKVDGKSYYALISAPKDLTGPVVIATTVDYYDVKEIAPGAFDGVTGITEVRLPEKLTTIGEYAFRNCTNLTTVTFSDKLTKILPHAFDGCGKLTSVTLPATVNEIGDYAFNGCLSLETVTFSGVKLRTIGIRAFGDCAKLATLAIPEGVTKIGGSAVAGTAFANTAANYEGGVLYSGKYALCVDPATRGAVTIKDGTTFIADRAFNNCAYVTSITIPASVTDRGSNLYDGCHMMIQNGTLVKEGDFDFIRGTAGYELVAYNGTGATVTLPTAVKGEKYAIRAYAFAQNTVITSVTIPAGVTAIGAHAFEGCTALATLTMGAEVTAIGDYAFAGCIALTDAAIGTGVTKLGDSSYNGCIKFTTLRIPDAVQTIGAQAFANCSALVNVHAGIGITEVGENAFYKCNELDNIYVTDLGAWCKIEFENMGAHPFSYYHESDSNKFFVNNAEITELTTPAGTTKIGSFAFYNCDRITKLTIGADLVSIGTYAFRSYRNGGLTEVVCTTTGWKYGTNLGHGGGTNITTITADALKDTNSKYYHYIYTK